MLINLHSHLEGRVRAHTAAEIADGIGLAAPEGGWAHALQLDEPADLTVFLAKVAASYPLFSSHDAIARIACEAVEDAAADGEDYLELRYGPATHVSDSLDLDGVVAAACEGVAEGSRRSGIPAGIVVAALRHHDRDTNLAVARAAARHAGGGVVGFDLAGDELLFPDLEPFVPAFGVARAAGLGITCHAAEAAPAGAARSAVELLGASRIGHGVRVADDPDVAAWLAEHGIVVEVCPTSNWFTGGIAAVSDHPAASFRRAGVPLVLGDDNPVQIGSLLSAERIVLREQLGFDADDLARLDAVSVEAAFVDPSTRESLRARLATS